jgi:hypothetical protein
MGWGQSLRFREIDWCRWVELLGHLRRGESAKAEGNERTVGPYAQIFFDFANQALS